MELSNTTKPLAGIIVITVPSIAFGGTFLLHLLKRSEHEYVDSPVRQFAGLVVRFLYGEFFQHLCDSELLPAGASIEWSCHSETAPPVGLGSLLSVNGTAYV